MSTNGFLTFKGSGSRLLKHPDDDSINAKLMLGETGWKQGILFSRITAFQEDGRPYRMLHRLTAYRQEDLVEIASALGQTERAGGDRLMDNLRAQGIAPETAVWLN